jgi:protein-tyrosine phosphatase
MAEPTHLLFVCLGNICRSPTAEAVMGALVAEAGLDDRIRCDSAGTGGWHVGDLPDERARETARRRGLELTHRGRQVRGPGDLRPFDLVLAMDRDNLADLRAMAPPEWPDDRIRLLREFEPGAPAGAEVPDPYYGGDDGFAEVFDICRRACRGLLEHLVEPGPA